MQFQLYGGNDEVEEKSGKNRGTGRCAFCDKRKQPYVGIKREKRKQSLHRKLLSRWKKHLNCVKIQMALLDISAYPVVKAGASPQVNIVF